MASPDVGRMGIEILSFTIKDIEDHVDYLDSLGKTQTAKVKRDADIGVAESNRDAGIRVRIILGKLGLEGPWSKITVNLFCFVLLFFFFI